MHIHKSNKMQTLESLYNLKSKIACDAGAYCLNRLQHITSFFESQVYALKKMPKEMHQYTWEIYHQISTSKGREKNTRSKEKDITKLRQKRWYNRNSFSPYKAI